ncbi:MAG: DUF87 domain-containing protein [Alphaproteobacteria bacterium]|jgi:hypothetical protein|nr:DUF87 domain-containing protein [Alphaproteobacteria bacterium]
MDSSPVFAHVIAVEGAKITAVINMTAAADRPSEASQDVSTHVPRGKILPGAQQKNAELNLQEIQIGAMVKIPTSRSVTFGLITSLAVSSGAEGARVTDQRLAKIELLGEALHSERIGVQFQFQRGVSVYPALWSPISLAENEDLAQIYARPSEACVRIGTIHQDASIPAYLLVDKLLGMHFAVLGTTGSGKSTTVALLLRQILTAYPQGRVLLLDPHNEYHQAFSDMSETMNTENLVLPYWMFNSEEIIALCVEKESPTFDRECSYLRDAVLYAKTRYNGETMPPEAVTIDSPIPYQMSDVLWYLNDKKGELEQPDGVGPYMRLIQKISRLKNDRRYKFVFPGLVIDDVFSKFCARLMRLPVMGKPITVFDLSGVPGEIVDIVVSVLCRILFDFAVWSKGVASAPLLLVCEEAHRYIAEDPTVGFAPTRKLIGKIAQEGRKYGLSLGLVTQRPSLLSQTILSQANTLIALRMANETDQSFVRKAVPETAFGLMNALPALKRQEAIISGEGVTLPMWVRFNNLTEAQRPRSETQSFTERWAKDDWTDEAVDQIIWQWRLGVRH